MGNDVAVSFSAFVDESELSAPDGLGVYLIAAAIVATDQLDATRDAITALRLGGQRKLHWRDENEARRGEVRYLDQLSGLVSVFEA